MPETMYTKREVEAYIRFAFVRGIQVTLERGRAVEGALDATLSEPEIDALALMVADTRLFASVVRDVLKHAPIAAIRSEAVLRAQARSAQEREEVPFRWQPDPDAPSA